MTHFWTYDRDNLGIFFRGSCRLIRGVGRATARPATELLAWRAGAKVPSYLPVMALPMIGQGPGKSRTGDKLNAAVRIQSADRCYNFKA